MIEYENGEKLPRRQLRKIAEKLKMLLLDVDGVLTDGGIILNETDRETKRFDVQDGMGVTLAQAAGIEVGIITGRVSGAVKRRAEELSIEHLYQGHFWKTEALDDILTEQDVDSHELGYVGDDVLDICILREVGMPLAPSNARPEVKQECCYVARSPGGGGAIREIVDWLLMLRGQKERIYESYARAEDPTA